MESSSSSSPCSSLFRIFESSDKEGKKAKKNDSVKYMALNHAIFEIFSCYLFFFHFHEERIKKKICYVFNLLLSRERKRAE